MKNIITRLFFVCTLFLAQLSSAEDLASEQATQGIDHIGLSVSNLDASTNFFIDALGFKVVGRDSKYPAAFLNDGNMSLTLWQTGDESVPFNRKQNVGLHHLAIKVTSFEALDSLYETVKTMPGVVIEFSPELAYGGPAKHMMIREPSGNRLEFVHRPK